MIGHHVSEKVVTVMEVNTEMEEIVIEKKKVITIMKSTLRKRVDSYFFYFPN
jgi:hypothetical protein